MKKAISKLSPKWRALVAAIVLVCVGALGAVVYGSIAVEKIPSEEDYTYDNPDETKAQTDEGIVIDGVLDEAVYQNNTWLYLHNEAGGAPVDIAMTSYYGEKGMYFVYDVTEETPIYVNLDRASYLNSGIEMYLAPSYVSSLQDNSVFEIDMLPTGDMVFKKSNGKGGYTKVTSTNDITAYLGATTKGGEVNTEDCYGYCLELFIPWEYMQWLDMDVETMKNSFTYVNPAHITSYNETGTDTNVDRFWYFFAQQRGASFGSVNSYFQFDGTGVLGTVPVTLVEGEHYTITGPKTVLPGMQAHITIKPEEGWALNSILVNEEEYIEKVSFQEDGSVVLALKGTKAGITVSAAAEAVTAGNKNLSGKVNVNKYGGDSQSGLLVSYKGPTGERPIELDSQGKFYLADLKQGYYEIIVEKEGYEKLVRGVYLNRDRNSILDLEYAFFENISGNAWDLEKQNKGILIKNSGSGVLLSTDSYNKFTLKANFRYDAGMAEQSPDDNYYFQQRSGFRIEFSNGKYWHINLMNEGGTYKIQYAKHTKDDSIFGWKTVHELTEGEIAQYKSQNGIQMTVLRDGKYANLYLGDRLVAIEVLDDEFEKCSARIGFETWQANDDAYEIPFSISRNVNLNIRDSFFTNAGGFDISGQYNNVLALTEGGRANIDFSKKYVNMDLTIHVQDYDDPENTSARNDVLLVFDNGAHVSFGVCYDGSNYIIQSLNNGPNDGKEIYKRYKWHGSLTEEEVEKYLTEGVDFRITRVGTEVTLYIDGRMVAVCDLTNNNSGVTATDAAIVTIRHYDDAGVKVEMPFAMTEQMQLVSVDYTEDALGIATGEKQHYLVGDTVVLSGEGKDGYYCTGIKVNGQEVPLNWDGTYSFTAENMAYTVESTYDKAIFAESDRWGLLEQNKGVITRPDGVPEGWLDFYDQYADFDITLKVQGIDETSATAVRFSFTGDSDQAAAMNLGNIFRSTSGVDSRFILGTGTQVMNEWATFRIVNEGGIWKLKSMNDTMFKWKDFYVLKEAEVEKYLSEGIDFRVVRSGTNVFLFLDGVRVCDAIDISKDKEGNPTGITPDMKAKVSIRHYGTTGKDVKIPFEVSDQLVAFKDTSVNGTVSVAEGFAQVGDTITLRGKGENGYYCTGIQVDGTNIEADANGNFTFKATAQTHTIEGIFEKSLFADNGKWNLLNHKNGVLSTTHQGNTGYMSTVDTYNQLSLTLCNPNGAIESYGVAGQFVFENGKIVNIQVTEWKDKYYVKSSNGASIYGGNDNYFTLSAAQAEKMEGEGITLKIVRAGTEMFLYLDGERVDSFKVGGKTVDRMDLTTDKDGNATGITADMTAKVEIASWCKAPAGTSAVVKFELAKANNTVTISDSSTNGKVVVDGVALFGESVTLKGEGTDGYYCIGIKVNGTPVTLNWDGTYTFTATENTYTVEGTFAKAVFVANNGWNLLEQNIGKVSLPIDHGNSAWLQFRDTFKDLDLQLNVKDYIKDNATGFSYAVQLYFPDVDKKFVVRTTYDSGIFGMQSMGGTYGYKWFYQPMTDAEKALLQSETGIDVKVVRSGTEAYLYLNGRIVKTVDLSVDKDGNATGITADMKATVSIKSDGNVGHEVVIPFKVTEQLNTVTFNDNSTNGKVVADGVAMVGESITIKGEGADGYYCTGIKVNGKDVTLNGDGTYTFTATENTYTVEGTFAKAVFVDNNGWNLLEQSVGKVSLPIDHGNSSWLQFRDTFKDLDLQLNVKDYIKDNATGFSYSVKLYFPEADKSFVVRTTLDSNIFGMQSMGGIYGYKWFYQPMTDAEKALLQSEAGIDFRVVRAGTEVYLYFGGSLVKIVDLTVDKDGNATGITADMEATVSIKSDGNVGHEVVIPFEVSNKLTTVTFTDSSTNGKVDAQKDTVLPGDAVVLRGEGADGYYCTGIKVNGTDVTLNWDGTYTFTATDEAYTVEGTFAKAIFEENENWNLLEQKDGIISTPHQGGTGYVSTLENYSSVSMIILNPTDANGVETIDDYSVATQFAFSNGKNVNIQVLEWKGAYIVKSASADSLYGNNYEYFRLTQEQMDKVHADGLKLTITRVGNELIFFLDGERVTDIKCGGGGIDLTVDKDGNATGIDAQTTSKIEFASWTKDADGTVVKVPFSVSNEQLQAVDINITPSIYGTITDVTPNRVTLLNETLTFTIQPGEDYNRVRWLVTSGDEIIEENNSVAVGEETYSFVATKDNYTVCAAYNKEIFEDNANWDLTQQYAGKIIREAGAAQDWLYMAGEYTDLSLTTWAKGSESNSFIARLYFTDSEVGIDKNIIFQIYNNNGTWILKTWGDSFTNGNYTYYTLGDEAKDFTGDGLEFQIVRVGTKVYVYLDGQRVYDAIDLTQDKDGATGITAETKMTVRFRHDAAAASDIEIPFTIVTDKGIERNKVYVSSANGVDDKEHGTEDAPFNTLEYALKMVDNYGTIYIVDDVTMDSDTIEAAYAKDITIRGVDDNSALNFTATTLNVKDSIRFTDVKITFADKTHIFAWGNTLEIAEDVTGIDKTGDAALAVYGGGNQKAVTGDTELILKAGIYRVVYGGGYKGDVTGNTSVTISHNANVSTAIDYTNHGYTYVVHGGGDEAAVNGNTTVNIGNPEATPNLTADNATRFNYVIGGGRFGKVTGDCTVNFYGYAMSVYGGSRGNSTALFVEGNTYVTMIDGYVQQIFGGCENGAMKGNTHVNVEAGTVVRRIYGGCYNDTEFTLDKIVPLTIGIKFTSTYAVNGYTNVSIGENVEFLGNFEQDIEVGDYSLTSKKLDNALYAISRGASTFDGECGTFIINTSVHEALTNAGHKLGYQDGSECSNNFSTQAYHYLVTTNGNKADGSLGKVTAVNDTLHIVPADGYAAKLTVNGTALFYCNEYDYTLAKLTSKDEKHTIEVTFVPQSDMDNHVGCVAQVGDDYYFDARMAVETANASGETLTVLDGTANIGEVNIGICTNGQVTTDTPYYIVGDAVTITVAGNTYTDARGESNTYYYSSLQVDGNEQKVTDEGTYTFTTTTTSHSVTASFKESMFRSNQNKYYNLMHQHTEGILVLRDDYSDLSALGIDFVDTYANCDVSIIIKADEEDFTADGTFNDTLVNGSNQAGDRTAIGFYTADKANVAFSILLDTDGKYYVAHAGTRINNNNVYGTKDNYIHAFTDAETELIKGDGIELRVVRIGKQAHVYLDGNWIYTHTLQYDATEETTVWIRRWDDTGVRIPIKYAISENVSNLVNVEVSSTTTGGIVTTDLEKYIPGVPVILTVTPDTNYNYTGLVVKHNGQVVHTDTQVFVGEGTVTFTPSEAGTYTVEATFEKEIFADHDQWDLTGQYDGVISTTNQGNTGYMSTLDTYNTLSMELCNPSGAISNFGVAGQFVFENGKIVNIQVTEWNNSYYVKTANANSIYGGNANYFTLDTEQTTKMESTGIELTIYRTGTNMLLYLDGVRVNAFTVGGATVDHMDLTKDASGNDTGITADMKATVEVCSWCKAPEGSEATVEFELSKDELPVSVVNIDTEIENGTITADKTLYAKGEMVTLTVAGTDSDSDGDADYYYNSLKVNGEEVNANGVVVDNDGNYKFEATEDSYKVTGSFAYTRFVANDKAAAWNLINQHFGIVVQPSSVTGNAPNLDFYPSTSHLYSDTSVIIKAGADDFDADGNFIDLEANGTSGKTGDRTAIRFWSSNGDYGYSVVLYTDGKYYVGRAGGTNGHDNSIYALSDEEMKLIKEGDGIEFRVVRIGTKVHLYLENKWVFTDDLPYAETEKTSVYLKRYDDGGVECPIEYTFSSSDEKPATAVVTIADNIENGTITVDKDSYLVGEPVKVTVAGESGYYYDSLIINGKSVMADNDGTYTFMAEAENTIEASFAASVFNENDNWYIMNQHFGIVAQRDTVTGNTSNLEFKTKSAISDTSIIVKAGTDDFDADGNLIDLEENGTSGLTGDRTAISYWASAGNVVGFGLVLQSDGKYYVQHSNTTALGNEKYTKVIYSLSDEENDMIIKGDGIELRSVRIGTMARLYLDGKLIYEYTLPYAESTNTTVYLKRWDDGGLECPVGYKFAATAPTTVSVNITNTGNGSLSTDVTAEDGSVLTTASDAFLVGQKVVLTPKPEDGYECSKVVINGKELTPNTDGTYSFKTTADVTSYDVEATFTATTSTTAITNLTNSYSLLSLFGLSLYKG